jgi:glyoxylase-like metal-dependent hydrolase (beta-lactamase superfamily II)
VVNEERVMHIEPFFDSRTATLTYVVFDETTRDALIIDPVLDFEPDGRIWTESVERVAQYVEAQKLTVRLIFETHVHADHLSGSRWLKERFGAPVAISQRISEVQSVFKGVFNWPQFPADGRQFDRLLADREVIHAGSLEVTALATPGHTPACMSLHIGDAVFTGDALFLDDVGVGRCDFPKGDPATLYQSVTQRLFTLPDTTRVFVGHDYPPPTRTWKASTTVGEAKRHNAQLRAEMSQAEFVEKRSARDKTLKPPRLLYPSLQVNIAAGEVPKTFVPGP